MALRTMWINVVVTAHECGSEDRRKKRGSGMPQYSAIVRVNFVRHRKRHKGVRIIPINGTFSDAQTARTHFHARHGEVLLVIPSSDAHRVVSESNYVLIPGDGSPS